MFYNTINEAGEELKQSQWNASTQENMVLEVFRLYHDQPLTPFEVYKILGTNAPLTSIRRAISDLAKKKLISKTNMKYRGAYGKANYCWALLQSH